MTNSNLCYNFGTLQPPQTARSGNAMLAVMLLVLVSTALSASALVYVNSRTRAGLKQVEMERAFYAAEAGAERAAVEIATIGPNATTVSGNVGSADYSATISRTSGATRYNYDILSVGTANGISRTIEIRRIHRVSWAQYSLWYDSEDPSSGLWMQAGDVFRGRVFSKPKLLFHDKNIATLGQVHFYDRVWSSASTIEKASSRVDPIFDRGLTLNASPEQVDPAEFDRLYAEANTKGLVLEGPTFVTIDGSNMRVTNAAQGWRNQLVQGMNNRLVYIKTRRNKKGTLTLSGPNGLNGQLTFAADDTINISNHVRYARNPMTYPDSTDSLGLIARQDVNVMTTAPNNLDIYAHIICLNGGFKVDRYNTGKHRGTLTVYGGIVNKVRKAVGTVGSPGTGYFKNYVYDERFNETPPPYYPERQDLEWSSWDERP